MINHFSQRFKFADWPNSAVPLITAGVYAIWNSETLIYCGMSGHNLNQTRQSSSKKRGLAIRLASHASGRLSGDQFCVYIANRFVIPSIIPAQFPEFISGNLDLDQLTKKYIHSNLEYQFSTSSSSKGALALEQKCRLGLIFESKPLLNPL